MTNIPTSIAKPRVLSGITPSGPLTLGNYLGALRRFVEGQDRSEGFFFVADLHAMTTGHEPARLQELTLQTASLFLAAGLDPQRATVFVQSHVPTHVELAYLLECTAYVGELGRMIQFKEKGKRPKTRASLFTYPCLMASDILLYDARSVPVGGDQDQHVELSRDLALRFNREYGETFVVPDPREGSPGGPGCGPRRSGRQDEQVGTGLGNGRDPDARQARPDQTEDRPRRHRFRRRRRSGSL